MNSVGMRRAGQNGLRKGDKKKLKMAQNNNLLLKKIAPQVKTMAKIKRNQKKFKTLQNQQEFMDSLYERVKLNKLEDWIDITRQFITKNGGRSLFREYQDIPTLLLAIYPNYPWKEEYLFNRRKNLKFKSIENQRMKMDDIYEKLELNSLDDWLRIKPSRISHNGGSLLYKQYQYNLQKLLQTIYSNYPWEFGSEKNQKRFKKLKTLRSQREMIDQLFKKFKFQSLEQWIETPQAKIIESGGENLLQYYNANMMTLLRSIYPNYPWNLHNNLEEKKIKAYITKYHITQKKDWYRVSSRYYQVVDQLKNYFPSEKWKKSHFVHRSKKSTQRILYSCTQRLYPSLLIYENYLHPKLYHLEKQYELDLFIPALQLALEYQGQQHYDDIPSGFGALDSSLYRDRLKEQIASNLSIKIVYIPFWWDHSLSSLLSSVQ